MIEMTAKELLYHYRDIYFDVIKNIPRAYIELQSMIIIAILGIVLIPIAFAYNVVRNYYKSKTKEEI
ncbi:MAG: hypothetical protein FWE23_08795 [Chitinivibrionia bacterium]|nr:hypothetical protein [Chitinivibrionia bacterium]